MHGMNPYVCSQASSDSDSDSDDMKGLRRSMDLYPSLLTPSETRSDDDVAAVVIVRLIAVEMKMNKRRVIRRNGLCAIFGR